MAVPPQDTPETIIGDPRQIQRLLEEAVQTASFAELAVDMDRMTATLRFPSEAYSPKEICFVVPPKENAEAWAARLKETQGTVSIKLTGSLILFDARVVSYDSKHLVFETPRKVSKIQRRRTARVEIPASEALRVRVRPKLTDQSHLVKAVYDISAGGIAFLVDAEERMLFQVGQKIEELILELKAQPIRSSGTVRGVWGLRESLKGAKPVGVHPPNSVKIAVEFDRLAQRDEAAIIRHVFDLQRRLGRKL